MPGLFDLTGRSALVTGGGPGFRPRYSEWAGRTRCPSGGIQS